MMKRAFLIFLLVSLFFTLVSAEIKINLAPAGTGTKIFNDSVLLNGTYSQSSSIILSYNVTGNASTYATCKLYDSLNSSWHERETQTSVSNNTNYNWSARTAVESPLSQWNWVVFCNETSAEPQNLGNWSSDPGNEGSNRSIGIDLTSPSLTRITYSSASNWDTNGNISILINVTENHPRECLLYSTFNATSPGNTSGTYNLTWQNLTYANGTEQVVWPNSWDTIHVNFLNNNTGKYYFNVTCDDLSRRTATTGFVYVFVDSAAPTDFDFQVADWRTNMRPLFNNTCGTDFTPQVGWNATYEANFSRFQIRFLGGNYSNTTFIETNVTTNNTLRTNVSRLLPDIDYFINITAFDLAGNAKQMNTLNYQYCTDSTNQELKSGWNIVGNPGRVFNLSDALSWSGATTVAVWNETHQFTTHVSGGSNGVVNVTPGKALLLYISADANFSDLVWDLTSLSANTSFLTNLTNQSASDWNLMVNLNHSQAFSLSEIDRYANSAYLNRSENNTWSNVSFFSYFNVTASTGKKYVPVVGNWSINNASYVEFGQVLWAFVNDASLKRNHSNSNANRTPMEVVQEFNWNQIKPR